MYCKIVSFQLLVSSSLTPTSTMHLAKHLFGVLLLLSHLPRHLHADPKTEISKQVNEFRSLGEKNLPLYMTLLVESFWSSDKFRDKYKRTISSKVYYLTDRSWNSYLKCLGFLETNNETTLSSMNTIIEQANENRELYATVRDELEDELDLPIKVPPDLKKDAFITGWTLIKLLNMDFEKLTIRMVLDSIVDGYLSWTSKLRLKPLSKKKQHRRQAELLLFVKPRFEALLKLQASLNLELASLKDPNLGDGCPYSQYIQTISNTLRELDYENEIKFISHDLFKTYMAPFALAINEQSPVSPSDLEYNEVLVNYINPEDKVQIPEWAFPLLPVTVSGIKKEGGLNNNKIIYIELAKHLLFKDFKLYYEDKDYRVTFRRMYRMQALWCIAILPKWKKIHKDLNNNRTSEKVPADIENRIKSQLAPELAEIAFTVNGVAPENTTSTNYGTFVRILFQCLLCTPRFRELFDQYPKKRFETTLDFLRRTLQIQMPNLPWPGLAQTPAEDYIKKLQGMSSTDTENEMENLLSGESKVRNRATLKWDEDWKEIAESFKWRYSVPFDRSFADLFLEQLFPGPCTSSSPVKLLARLLISFLPLYETAVEKDREEATSSKNLKSAIQKPENINALDKDEADPDNQAMNSRLVDKRWYQKWPVLAVIGLAGAGVLSVYWNVPSRIISWFQNGPFLSKDTSTSRNSTGAHTFPIWGIILVLSVILLLSLLAVFLYRNPRFFAGQPKDAISKVQTEKTKKRKKNKGSIQTKTTLSSTAVSDVLTTSSAALSRALTQKPSVSSTGSTITSRQGRSKFQSSTIYRQNSSVSLANHQKRSPVSSK